MADQTQQASATRSPWRYIAIAASAVVLWLLTVALLAAVLGGEDRFTVRGTFDLTDGATGHTTEGGACAGYRGYDDIAAGTPVIVSNQTGEIVGQGYLAPAYSYSSGVCSFVFEVPDVPDDATFYQIEVSHRGSITVQPEEAKGGHVALTLGD